MRIKKIKLKNIRSYENLELEFPAGSILLAGDVGSGKTSILLAIEYALFGLQPGQTGSALLRNDASTGEVSLELEIYGNNVIIERKLKRGKTITNEYSAITINGEKIESSITELKTKILSLLNYPSEFIKKNNLLYRYTVYTPQEQMKQIILEDPETRLNVLRHIFGIDKYKLIRENLTILLGKIKEDTRVLQGEIKNLDSDKVRLQSIRSFTAVLNEKITEKEVSLVQLIARRKNIEKESEELESRIKEGEKMETELEKTKILIASKKDNLYHMIKEISEREKTLTQVRDSFKEEDLQEVVRQLAAKRTELELLNRKYIEFIGSMNSLEQLSRESLAKKERIFRIDICPTCLQTVSAVYKDNILHDVDKSISENLKKRQKLEKERYALSSHLETIKIEIENLENLKVNLEVLRSRVTDLERSKDKLLELKKGKDNLDKDLSLLDRHIDVLKASILSFSRFRTHYRLKNEELKKAFLEEKNNEISLAELKKELELTFKEIALLDGLIAGKESARNKLNDLLEMSDWLSTQFLSLIDYTERNVMLKLRMEFSLLFSKWFGMLAGESFQVQLDENFTPLIMLGDSEMEYAHISGGERTAVALAYRLALNQTINSLLSNIKTREIVILDEPTEGFSDAQIVKIRDVLEELRVKQLIIVSHEQKIESFVDNVIRLKKDGDVSKVDDLSFLFLEDK